MEDRVLVFDTSLGEGERSPGCTLSLEEKLRMARQLERLCVDIIEAGSPMNSSPDFEAVRLIARSIETSAVAARCRPTRTEIDRAWEAIEAAKKRCLHLVLSAAASGESSRQHETPEEMLQEAMTAVHYARSLSDRVILTIEHATEMELVFLVRTAAAAGEAGAAVVTLADTAGYSTPDEYGALFQAVSDMLGPARGFALGAHTQNDLGLAVANSLAAIQHGARHIICTVNGIGERTGCTALEEIVLLLRARKDRWGFCTNVAREEIYKTSRLYASLTGMPVSRNKPIIGANAFAYQSNPAADERTSSRSFERITPQSVGIKHSTMLLSKHADKHALSQRYADLGYSVLPEELERAYHLFRQIAEQKREIIDDDLIAILENPTIDAEEMYHLADIQVHSGTTLRPTATVELRSGNERKIDSATGDGPVDAVYKAIERITGVKGNLADYLIRLVGTGTDAIGEVFVRVNFDGTVFHGRGLSIDVLTGSALAYLEALNRAMLARKRRSAP